MDVDGSGDPNDVCRLGPSLAGPDLELDPLALVQGAEAATLDRRVVDEEFLQRFRCDETVSLLIVEPLHSATHHVTAPSVDEESHNSGPIRASAATPGPPRPQDPQVPPAPDPRSSHFLVFARVSPAGRAWAAVQRS